MSRLDSAHSQPIPGLRTNTVVAGEQALRIPGTLDVQQLVVVVYAPELLLPTGLKVVCLIEVGPGTRGILPELVQGLMGMQVIYEDVDKKN